VAVFIAGIVTLIVTAIRRNRRITVEPPLRPLLWTSHS